EALTTALVHRPDRADGRTRGTVKVSSVSPSYFETVKLPVLRGRVFTRTTAASDVLISQTAARMLWGSGEPVGEALVDASGGSLSVIGVVGDVDMLSTPTAMLYRRRSDAESGGVLLARVDADASAMAQRLRPVVAQLDPSGAVPRTLASAFQDLATKFSVLVKFVGLLGVVGVVLTVIGLYGVVAFAASGRTKEIGIRMALGADAPLIMRMLLASGIAPVAVGLSGGFLLALAARGALARILKGTPVPLDVR